jgi:hypothetical protein
LSGVFPWHRRAPDTQNCMRLTTKQVTAEGCGGLPQRPSQEGLTVLIAAISFLCTRDHLFVCLLSLLCSKEKVRELSNGVGGVARGSVAVQALCYKPEGRGFETHCGYYILSIYPIFLATLGPGVYSASNRNQYQR